jgi:hypothetical protein
MNVSRSGKFKSVLALVFGLAVGTTASAEAMTKNQCHEMYETTVRFCASLSTNGERGRCYERAAEVLALCIRDSEDRTGSCRVAGLFCLGGGGGLGGRGF